MPIQSLRLQNLLSFGPRAETITLGDLNVIIGPNGSGKSNLIEALALLKAAPDSLSHFIRESGGVSDWLWKGVKETPTAHLEATAHAMPGTSPMRLKYELAFTRLAQRLEVVSERIEQAEPPEGTEPEQYFSSADGRPRIRMRGHWRGIDPKDFKTSESILSQRRDPEAYPELFAFEAAFSAISLYRDWTFGRYSPPRLPQPADLPNDYLLPDASNLGLVLNQIRKNPEAKEALLNHLSVVYEGIRDVGVSIEGGTVQVFLYENKWVMPAARLSDGTLRWLSLLAILLNPNPQRLVAIEEPEMGLHPDLLPLLAQLLREASQRMQLVVTTHSDALVDALSDTPESVLVCEKHEGSTTMRRLDPKALSEWLKEYTLGQLWRRGEIGGNRW